MALYLWLFLIILCLLAYLQFWLFVFPFVVLVYLAFMTVFLVLLYLLRSSQVCIVRLDSRLYWLLLWLFMPWYLFWLMFVFAHEVCLPFDRTLSHLDVLFSMVFLLWLDWISRLWLLVFVCRISCIIHCTLFVVLLVFVLVCSFALYFVIVLVLF